MNTKYTLKKQKFKNDDAEVFPDGFLFESNGKFRKRKTKLK